MKAIPLCFLILLFIVLPAAVQAGQMELVLVAPQEDVQAGQQASFTIYFNNLGKDEISTDQYNKLSCSLISKTKTVGVTATAQDNVPLVISGNGFVKKEFSFTIPADMTGDLKIQLTDIGANHGTFIARAAPIKEISGGQMSITEGTSLFQPFAKKFSGHEPMYFLLGVDPGIEKSSFQISFKYQIFNEQGYLGEKAPWIKGFHFAYTQKSLWDLDSDSAPFEDTSYKPEFFYIFDKIDLGVSWVSAFGIQTGFQHESNGNEGLESRSTNYIYIKPILGFPLWGEYHLIFAPKVWAYVNNDDGSNGDLDDYRGYFELETKIGAPKSFMLGSYYRYGDEGGSSYQLDLSYPLNKLFGGSLDMYIHAQYFNGYAETLLNYNQKYDAFRIGISLVR